MVPPFLLNHQLLIIIIIIIIINNTLSTLSTQHSPMTSKLCDSCKSATATLFCRPDSAFLCLPCDSKIHAANKLASRHPRVPLCEVCEQAPAHVTCKADAAALCVTCDRDIHSANPLARRHDRIPIAPFYDSSSAAVKPAAAAINFLDDNTYFSDADTDDVSREEAEAASWLLPAPSNPKAPDPNSGQYVFPEIDPVPYVDLEFGSVNPKMESREQNSSGTTTDGVVPFVYGYNYKYNTQSQCVSLSHSVSSSSMEVGVVPDANTMSEISNCCTAPVTVAGDHETVAVAISGADREARVLRYREKRKNRRFEKTIRYASRKAYAETRPRIKGRFAKRTDVDVLVEEDPFAGYGVVPTC